MRRFCLILLSGCSGAAAPSPSPKPVATTAVTSTTAEPVEVCPERELALEATAAHLKAGELERAYQAVAKVRASCPDDDVVVQKQIDVAIAQGRFAEAEALLGARAERRDLDGIRERLRTARDAARKGRDLVAMATVADPVQARRLYDQALVAFEREQQAKPQLVFLAHARGEPRPKAQGDYTLWPSLDADGRLGWILADRSGSPQRWYLGNSARFITSQVLMVDAMLVHLELGVVRDAPFSFEPRVSNGGKLVVGGGAVPKVFLLSDLSEVASIDTRLGQGIEQARWLDAHRVVLWSSGGAVVFDVKKKASILEVQGEVALSRSGRYLAHLSWTTAATRVVVHDLKTNREAFSAGVPFRPWSRALAFSPDGRRLVYLPNDGTAHAFSIPGGARRTLGKRGADQPELELRAAYVTNDGYVCANRGFHKYGTCENDVLFSLAGRPLRAKGARKLVCLPGPDGMRVVSYPRGPLTGASRKVFASGSRPGVWACNRALNDDGTEAAWLEGEEVDDMLREAVLVHFDPRSGRVLHEIPLEAPKQRLLYDTSFDLAFADGLLTVHLEQKTFVLEATTGKMSTTSRRRLFPRPVDLRGAGDGQAWSASTVWDLQTLQGTASTTVPRTSKRHDVRGGEVRLTDGEHEVARVTLYGPSHALVRYPDGTLEPHGFAPDELACAFGVEVAPWAVCVHRLTSTKTYEERWRAAIGLAPL